MSRNYISESTREAVFRLQSGRCFYNSSHVLVFNNRTSGLRGAWHVEHLQAYSRGGNDTLDNLRAVCINCNLSKGDQTQYEWDKVHVPRCHGRLQDGTPCQYSVAQGNKKYCGIHTTKKRD